ncbi:nuclear receptor subfamily 1 group I member 3 isoform X2 [Ornithorhynchus anatinus]|nr:nuclear receptor subfamily 1 group I member 3 isoform X2 [Ornithorhynchus anatinus]
MEARYQINQGTRLSAREIPRPSPAPHTVRFPIPPRLSGSRCQRSGDSEKKSSSLASALGPRCTPPIRPEPPPAQSSTPRRTEVPVERPGMSGGEGPCPGAGEGEVRSCAVCGDHATGYHFHALTCEGCKGFFRRTISKGTSLTCPFTRCCVVTKAQRRQCPACRLQKCLDAGMRKDMILSAETLALRRARRAQQRVQRAFGQLSKEQEGLIQLLLGAHARHVVPMFLQFVQFRPPDHLFVHNKSRAPPTSPPPVFPLLTHLADISTFMIQQIIKFTKDLPPFRSLPMEDQISLLKGAALEMGEIELNLVFCAQDHSFLCGPLRYTLQDAIHDRPGVTQREQIDRLQEETALTLQGYIQRRRPWAQGRLLYAKLLGLLTELRSINVEYGRQVQHIQGLWVMMPLLQEICS